MKPRPWIALLVAVAALTVPAGLAAQADGDGLREAALSSVVTVPVRLPPSVEPRAGDPITYRVAPAPGFRVVGPSEAAADLRAGDPPVVSITLAVGSRLAAGEHVAARVEFASPGRVDTVRVPLRIRPSAGFRLSLVPPAGVAEPGTRIRLAFEIANDGNVADTVALSTESRLGETAFRDGEIALAPFETVRGEFEVDVAADALPLPTLVVARAVGRHDTASATLQVPVGRADGFLASLVRVPARVFLGSSVRGGDAADAGSAYGVEAEGELRPGLRLRVEAHGGASAGVSGFAFRGLDVGPRFRARLASPDFVLAAGEVTSRTASFAGSRLAGRGVAGEATAGAFRVEGHLAVPAAAGRTAGGHQLAGGVDLRTPAVVIGARGLSDLRRDTPVHPARRLRSAWLRLAPAVPSRHGFLLEAGWMGLEDLATDEAVDGPALAGRYAYRDDTSYLDVVLRRQPALASGRSAPPEELRIAATTRAAGPVGLRGQLHRLGGGAEPARALRSDGADLGLFVPLSGGRLELLGRLRRLRGADRVDERSLELAADAGIGPGTADARLEIGRSRSPTLPAGTLLRSTAGYTISGSDGWGRLGLTYRRDAWDPGVVSLDVAGAWRPARRVEIHGSYAGSADRFDVGRVTLAQLGVQVDVRPDLSLLAGLEKLRSGSAGSAVQVSVGLRKGFPLPLPVPRQQPVEGTVFEDLDGDGRRSPDEPFADGVRLTMGGLTVGTRRGYFAFPTGARQEPVQVDPLSLGPGFLLPPPFVASDADDRLDIPLHRAASLRVEAFLDQDGDGRRDPTERPLPDVSLEVSTGDRTGWSLRTDADGSVELEAVRPGSYVVRVDAATLPRRASRPGRVAATLRAGESAVLLVAVPARAVVLLDVADPGRGDAGAAVGVDDAGGGRK